MLKLYAACGFDLRMPFVHRRGSVPGVPLLVHMALSRTLSSRPHDIRTLSSLPPPVFT